MKWIYYRIQHIIVQDQDGQNNNILFNALERTFRPKIKSSILAAEMKFMRKKKSGYDWTDYKTNIEVFKFITCLVILIKFTFSLKDQDIVNIVTACVKKKQLHGLVKTTKTFNVLTEEF